MEEFERKETELILCIYEQSLVPKEDLIKYIDLRKLIEFIIEDESEE